MYFCLNKCWSKNGEICCNRFRDSQLAADQCLFGGDRRDEPGGSKTGFTVWFILHRIFIPGVIQLFTVWVGRIPRKLWLFLRYGGKLLRWLKGYLWWLTIACSTRDAWKLSFGFTKWIIPVTPFTVPTAFPGNYLKDWKIISYIPFLPFADMTWKIIIMPWPMPRLQLSLCNPFCSNVPIYSRIIQSYICTLINNSIIYNFEKAWTKPDFSLVSWSRK